MEVAELLWPMAMSSIVLLKGSLRLFVDWLVLLEDKGMVSRFLRLFS